MTADSYLGRMWIMKPREGDFAKSDGGFTRAELLVVLFTLGLIGVVTRPVWANAIAVKSLGCMENLRRLSAAWLLYTDDNAGKFVGNYHGGFVPGTSGKESPWVTGCLDWTTSSDNTNTVYLTNSRYAALAVYLGQGTTVFKCPADDYLSRPQAARGWWGRVRSYSLNCAIGEGNYYTGPINPRVRQITSNSEFGRLVPQQTFLFLDEHPDSIDDGMFFVPSSETRMPELPGSLHEGAAWISFADGHLELHRWETSEVKRPVSATDYQYLNNVSVTAGNPDAAWLLAHTPQK